MTNMNSTDYFDLDDPLQWTTTRLVLAQAKNLKDKIAIDFINGPVWTFANCEFHARAAAARLKAMGIHAGEKVAVMVNAPEDFCRYWLGLNFIGATMVAINTSMRGATLKHQLVLSECRFVISDQQNSEACRRTDHVATMLTIDEIDNITDQLLPIEQVVKGNNHDLSCVMFTSGTSGPSKGVLMPQAHCMLFAVGTIDNYKLTAEDCFYICLPLFHANGLFMQLQACLAIGCKAVIRQKFSASKWLDDIRHFKITHTNTLGAVAAFIVAQPATPKDKDHQLKVIGAAPLPAVAEDAFRHRYGVPSVVPLYGMTEVNIPLYGKLNESAPGTCGHVYDKYFYVEIRDSETDESIADGDQGEIMVRPKLTHGFMSGYVGMPEETLKSWRNFWFHTGDAGYRNRSGHFIFIDRIKDCIRKRGENISSYEVEQAFLQIEAIAEVAAYAVPADGGEGMEDEVMITVLLKNNTTINIDHWIECAKQDLPAFALPRYIRIQDQLPKTQTGKIRKVTLREEGVTADTVDRFDKRNPI